MYVTSYATVMARYKEAQSLLHTGFYFTWGRGRGGEAATVAPNNQTWYEPMQNSTAKIE